ncbi:arsenical pump-driving ATPase [Schinkia azotoformans]|uniref:arsenical pump-driving ATPase n=1 Tax=Schinkia azotoformans TaxID=1454 RepID=UPI002DBB3CBD|nr:arsenical pump-driving ATPase [Schinkia azotoformans]MEC1743321.1 arsenical pump-driving ATPase [Schinkia azotoformans]MEC1769259.1 arsenical pump-driving ATPase [Schinkia azotoformans]MEC1788674.1 arsenical pump-driving ATPase [Schinkia azotoformans]MED4377345.1 arsenical pump-driving ATPase [Schinkia azotoformans]MED4420182.1 arsenical pump-driving ATPase [Schinkia azotoformans]
MFTKFDPKKLELTHYIFFTGKGGVGKTSTACATAVALAEQGKKVLIVSTDPASNLEDVFEMELGSEPKPINDVPNLYASDLDPEEAAQKYRDKTVGPYRGKLPDAVIANMEEQLSGACTVEIAAFDEFTNLLANPAVKSEYDHIIFDTAPTGHTLRLLQLPTAWSGFLEDSTHGASCLGPLSGLNEKKQLYAETMEALADKENTTLVLVARPDSSSLTEAARASDELKGIGIQNQVLVVNGMLSNFVQEDEVSTAFYNRQQDALKIMPEPLKNVMTYELPLVPFNLTGVQNVTKLFSDDFNEIDQLNETIPSNLLGLKDVIEDFSQKQKGVIFTMGKGGVGKTTVASAIAVGLVEKGHRVHLTTTDPAAHLSFVFENESLKDNLTISRIDPRKVVEEYRQEVLDKACETVDEAGLAYLEEDLRSPCTEEIAVFRAFADVVEKAENEFVVIDTAPTGHTLLLLDATQSYHKELARSTGEIPESVVKLLPRLRNPEETNVVIVTLAEATPVFEAKRLQDDLRRAGIDPKWWVINQSMFATNTNDPVLKGRASSEIGWINKVQDDFANKCAIIPWNPEATVGYDNLIVLSQ